MFVDDESCIFYYVVFFKSYYGKKVLYERVICENINFLIIIFNVINCFINGDCYLIIVIVCNLVSFCNVRESDVFVIDFSLFYLGGFLFGYFW